MKNDKVEKFLNFLDEHSIIETVLHAYCVNRNNVYVDDSRIDIYGFPHYVCGTSAY